LESPALTDKSKLLTRGSKTRADSNHKKATPKNREDPKTGESHYTIRIAIPERELARLGSMKLLPGMPHRGLRANA